MTETEINLNRYLVATQLINSSHPKIIDKAIELTKDLDTPDEKARNLFYFMRDEIRYVFHADKEKEFYQASSILEKGRGFCTQKSILFCALARASNIPAGIYFYDIDDYTLPKNFVNLLRTRRLYRHGIVSLFLNGEWHKYDATLDIKLVNRNKLVPVEFIPNQDCLMHAKTQTGEKHIEYVKDYGMVADVSYEEIRSWFKKYYGHLMK